MKVLRKNLVLEGQDLPYVMLEREIMIQSRSNPFIIQLMYAFQDAQRLYFVMEVAKGGNFYRLLIKQAPKPFPYERIVFHSGEIACALAFLHSKRIVRSFFLFYLQNQIYRLFFHRHIVTSNRKTFLYLTTVILNSVISVYVGKISINIHVQRHSVARKNILPMKSTNIANTTKMSIGGH